jgi:hypothetical protein
VVLEIIDCCRSLEAESGRERDSTLWDSKRG